jgi:hypothetical protein
VEDALRNRNINVKHVESISGVYISGKPTDVVCRGRRHINAERVDAIIEAERTLLLREGGQAAGRHLRGDQ